jgi:cell wall-associated NlpC family hydrolase
MKLFVRSLCILAVIGLVAAVASAPAQAGTRPSVTGLSAHYSVYWGGGRVTVSGHNFTHVKKVTFGRKRGWDVHVLSSTRLTVRSPEHKYGQIHVRVTTSTGTSTRGWADRFTFTHPTMNSHIQGGLTGRQEQRISATIRATHRGVFTAHRASHWTRGMGATAVARARSWLGLPYSWAGGNSRGPTRGVCAHNGGDLDCHIVGFDCSGLALYSWAPYKRLIHYAATQHVQAGRFHPTIGQLMPGDLVFFSGYIANGIGHVAVYEGHGNVIQAEQSGSTVKRSRLVDVIAHSGRYRGATRPMSTGRQGSGPHLSSMTSQLSVKGGYVTIIGSHLGLATSVSVGATRIYSFAHRSATRLVVKVPAHRAGRVTVAVSNPWATSQRTLTYVGAPAVSTLSPATGWTTGTTSVTITGANLATVSQVKFGTTLAMIRYRSATRLTLTAPPHPEGAVWVRLYSRFGTSNVKLFTYFTRVTPTTPASAASTTPAAPTTSSSSSTPPSSTSSTTTPPSSSTSSATTPPSTSTTTPPPTSTSSSTSTAPASSSSTAASSSASPTTGG